jgi:hypothetical protein
MDVTNHKLCVINPNSEILLKNMPTTFFTVHLNDVRVVDLVPVDKVYVFFLSYSFFPFPW